jgi:pyruvate dehydrogenase E2 component (dihydrolipoamide acetyltransferase)
MELRKKLKADRSDSGLAKITLNDMVVFAVSRTLPSFPDLNAHLIDDKMRIFRNAHVGVAVDTERGLMVPTLFDANRKSLLESSLEVKSLIEQCHAGNINPDYLQGGTFTVTNLGPFGIETFSPIINLPQTGILGVNTIEWKIKQKDGEFIHYPAMGLSLTFDHRAVDGAYGARFLQELTAKLEAFSLLLCV